MKSSVTLCALMVMPALALQIHGIQDLRLHLAGLEAAALLDEPIGQRRFAVIDVGDDGEIADIFH